MRRSIAVLALLALAVSCAGAHDALAPTAPVVPDTVRTPVAPVITPLSIRFLDVGQGDAALIASGVNRVLIDGGPDPVRMGRLLDSLGLNNTTFDAVIVTHMHADHYTGVTALFQTARHITIRHFYTPGRYAASATHALRDSIAARVGRHEMVESPTTAPCGSPTLICTLTMNGSLLHLVPPMVVTDSTDENDRSLAVKVVGPDSASFTAWLGGDAERPEMAWFEQTYGSTMGLGVTVAKLGHHGSCNGTTAEWMARLHPAIAVASVGAVNSYGHMHLQTRSVLAAAHIPWLRTDSNGTVEVLTLGTPGDSYKTVYSHGTPNMTGFSDAKSSQTVCAPGSM